jgi:hypothetical protein
VKGPAARGGTAAATAGGRGEAAAGGRGEAAAGARGAVASAASAACGEMQRRRRRESVLPFLFLISSGMESGAILSMSFSLNHQNTTKYFKRANYIVTNVNYGK